MVEGTRPISHLAELAYLQHRASGGSHPARFLSTLDRSRPRLEIRRHTPRRTPALCPPGHARYAGAGLFHRRFFHRYVDRHPLRRLAWFGGAGRRLARCRFRSTALLLSVRSAVLRPAARLCPGAGDPFDSGLLGRRARLAVAPPVSGPGQRPRDGRQLFQAGRRPGIAVPARRRSGAVARHGREVLPRPLRDGLQPARLVHGGHRLGGPECRSPHAMAAHPGCARRRGAGVDGTLDESGIHGHRIDPGFRRAAHRERRLRGAQ